MILLQESPIEEIRRTKKEIKSKRHELHVMMSAYCTINSDENTEEKKEVCKQKNAA
jgi:hypothetical protein